MAKIDVKANVIAPAEVNVTLIRADRASVANIFRLFFEILLALTSTLVGTVLSDPHPAVFKIVALVIGVILTIAFAVISFTFSRPEKSS